MWVECKEYLHTNTPPFHHILIGGIPLKMKASENPDDDNIIGKIQIERQLKDIEVNPTPPQVPVPVALKPSVELDLEVYEAENRLLYVEKKIEEEVVEEPKKAFPEHWGDLPKKIDGETELPDGYGTGSQELAEWIESKTRMDEEENARETENRDALLSGAEKSIDSGADADDESEGPNLYIIVAVVILVVVLAVAFLFELRRRSAPSPHNGSEPPLSNYGFNPRHDHRNRDLMFP